MHLALPQYRVILLSFDMMCLLQYPMYSRDYVYARKYKVIVGVICVYVVATADRIL